MHLLNLVSLSGLLVLVAAQELKIHGKPVNSECLKVFKAAQAPEIDRTLKFLYLAGNVTQPADLKERVTKANDALQAYQNILVKVDTNLAEPVPKADIVTLVQAHRATEDIEATLSLVAKSEDPGVKSALKEFGEARKLEFAANTLIEKNCPPDVDDLVRNRIGLSDKNL